MSDETVTLTKLCELHVIDLPREGGLVDRFKEAFPSASFNDEEGQWHMVWKRGTYAESNARLEKFFSENGVSFTHIDKC